MDTACGCVFRTNGWPKTKIDEWKDFAGFLTKKKQVFLIVQTWFAVKRKCEHKNSIYIQTQAIILCKLKSIYAWRCDKELNVFVCLVFTTFNYVWKMISLILLKFIYWISQICKSKDINPIPLFLDCTVFMRGRVDQALYQIKFFNFFFKVELKKT